MRRLLIVGVIGLVLALAIPVANLFIAPNNAARVPSPQSVKQGWNAVASIFAAKCVHCHTADAELPFYASWPVAKQIIRQDVESGLAIFDIGDALTGSNSKAYSEPTLAKLEYSMLKKDMPPPAYLALHWNHSMSSDDTKTVLDWIRAYRTEHYAGEAVAQKHNSGAIQPLPKNVAADARKVALGDRMFHDKRLSIDNTLACASCHGLDKGGTDRAQFSTGVNGQVGDINAPTVFNSGFQFKQFWDGRAADLFEQADGPVNNPIEMGANWPDVLGKLKTDEPLVQEFAAIYTDGLTERNIREAIATFEKTLVTPSRVDDYLRGDDKALNAQERSGMDLFVDKGCAMCHAGKIIGGQSFEKMGIHRDYFAERGKVGKADMGRFNVTKQPRDKHRFKVPTLRNIALTAPYFHDGSVRSLRKAVEIMAVQQLEDTFTDQHYSDIVAFLNALTGTYKGKLLN